jgi:hypothetical protein
MSPSDPAAVQPTSMGLTGFVPKERKARRWTTTKNSPGRDAMRCSGVEPVNSSEHISALCILLNNHVHTLGIQPSLTIRGPRNQYRNDYLEWVAAGMQQHGKLHGASCLMGKSKPTLKVWQTLPENQNCSKITEWPYQRRAVGLNP